MKSKKKISNLISMPREVNIDSKNLKSVRLQVGVKLVKKSNLLTNTAFESFQHTVENGNRESIRKVNDMLDGLGQTAQAKKMTIKGFNEIQKQKGVIVEVKNLEKPKTSAYFKF